MGKRKRNSVNPFKKDKERAGKKGNPIYRVAGAGVKPRAGSKKEVNLHNRALVEALDQQLGQQQQQAALNKSQKQQQKQPEPESAATRPAPPQQGEKTVDERVDELSETLKQA